MPDIFHNFVTVVDSCSSVSRVYNIFIFVNGLPDHLHGNHIKLHFCANTHHFGKSICLFSVANNSYHASDGDVVYVTEYSVTTTDTTICCSVKFSVHKIQNFSECYSVSLLS